MTAARVTSYLQRPMPLPAKQTSEILRYWLASLQLDEALSARPRARRPTRETHAPRVDAPTPGQDYFKLAFDPELEAVLCARGQLQRPLDAELGAFFEHWLATQYRRGRDEDRDVSHLLVFPVVHLPRGELAGLLRYDVSLRFCSADGSEFTV
ncbi:MAG TPA: hypothetical protein VJR89_29770, partial [Polyangiales bacterium]|nr:hypothetical protein [Polyangiales bacterium]